MRYIDDFVVCFQYRDDALRFQNVLRKRLGKFGLVLEPTKTKLVEFGRLAQRYAGKHGRKRPETIYFLGMILYCTQNRKGNFRVGLRTEKSRLQRSLAHLRDLMRRMRHLPVRGIRSQSHDGSPSATPDLDALGEAIRFIAPPGLILENLVAPDASAWLAGRIARPPGSCRRSSAVPRSSGRWEVRCR